MLGILIIFMFHSICLDVCSLLPHTSITKTLPSLYIKTLLDLRCRKANIKAVRMELSHYSQRRTLCHPCHL